MKKIELLLFFLLFSIFTFSQSDYEWQPPAKGPGSPTYTHQKVIQYDFAQKADGYWLFEPSSPRPDSANVVIFNHGYGGYNPMIYGKWIEHLVKKGNIVIFPRYQSNVYLPRPSKFSRYVSQAIRDAYQKMEKENFVKPRKKGLAMVGHSYGGVISADLAVNFENHKIPKPVAVFLVSPGTGPLSGGILKSYAEMPSDIKLNIMVSQYDHVVGEKFGKKVFNSAKHLEQINYIKQYSDASVEPSISSGHNESYSLDMHYDNGKRNFTSKRALRIGKLDNIDYYGYWKIFDAMLDCSREGTNCQYAFGNTPEQKYLGLDANGKPIKELEITIPSKEKVSNLSSQ